MKAFINWVNYVKDVPGIKYVFLIVLTIWFMGFFHESGHSLVALISGIHPSEIKWIFENLVPMAIIVPIEKIPSDLISYYYYGGGFLSGTIFFIMSIVSLLKYLHSHTFFSWFTSTFLFGFSLAEFYEGYMEGGKHEAYVKGESLYITYLIVFITILISNILYYKILRKRKAKSYVE